MLNKDFYFKKLDEIEKALDEAEWYNSTEYNENWWSGFFAGFFTPFVLTTAGFLLWAFIRSASH